MNLAILGLLLALASPLLLLPVEKILPYPHFIEEVIKLVIVGVIIKTEKQTKRNLWFWIFMVGFLFAISESILYLVNIFALGDLMAFPKRLVLTGGLHIGTVMLMYLLGRKKYAGLFVGFIIAIAIHYFFNIWVVNL